MATAAGDELEKILLSVDNTPLDPDDNLFDVKKALIPVVAEWRAIGEGLRLRGGTLNMINKNHPNDAISCMGAVASEWLNRNYSIDRFGEPTWRNLVEIIGSPMGGNNLNHARKIAQQHPGSKPPSLIRSDTISKEVAALQEKVQEQGRQMARSQREKQELVEAVEKIHKLEQQLRTLKSTESDSSRKEVAALREQVEEMLPPTKPESVDERTITQQRKREHQPPQLPAWFKKLNDRSATIGDISGIRTTTISDSEANLLAENLRVNKTLEALRLVNVNVSDIGYTTLAEAMRDNQSLTTLNIYNTKISDSGANALSTAIQENKTLQTLWVDFRSVSNGGARDFTKKMEGWSSSLMTLGIWNTRNNSGEVKRLLRETASRKGINLTLP